MRIYFVYVLDDRSRGDEIAWSAMVPFYSLEDADDEAWYIANHQKNYYGFDDTALKIHPLRGNALRYSIAHTSLHVIIREILI
jgi:hypothetical protein